LRTYLTEEPDLQPRTGITVHRQDQRAPGPFIEDEMVLPPITLARASSEVTCSRLLDTMRLPDRFPAE
jgi:hypothetical protein